MSHARCVASIDEPALRLEHLRVGTRYHQGAIDPLKHAIQCFGARHIPFDEFDTWQFRERDRPRPIAHQRAHRYAVARKFTYNRGAAQAGSAGYQDHANLHRRRRLRSTGHTYSHATTPQTMKLNATLIPNMARDDMLSPPA